MERLIFAAFYSTFGRWVSTSLSLVFLLWAASALLTFYVYLLVSAEDPRHAARLSLRSSAVGVWFAPAILLLSGLSTTSFFVSVLLAVNTAGVLVSRWPIRAQTTPFARSPAILSPPQIRTGFLSRKSFPAFLAALLLLSGITGKLWRWPITSAACMVGGAAIVTVLSLITGAASQQRKPKAPPSAFGVLLTLILASTFSVGVLGIHGARADSSGGAGDVPRETATRLYQPGSDKESFPGVVLKTRPKPQPEIAPRFYFSKSNPLRQPQSIEFSGEYWMLRRRYDRPPANALISDSSPLDFIFRTTDAGPMKMEAHQPLERPIELTCCSQIQVVIDDADHHPAAVSLELVLLDGASRLSLGADAVGSEKTQTLDYPIPAALALTQFDQIQVIFDRDPMRIDRSANLALERFILIPR